MQDKEIEEALKYCPSRDVNNHCRKCPLKGVICCRDELMRKSLDYIKRLKKEYNLPYKSGYTI